MDPYLRRDPEYQSFVTVFRGFQYVGKVLEPYTKAGLRRVHQAAYRTNAGMPQCVQQCSRRHGNNTQRWCQTCKAWKNIIIRYRKRPFTRWEITESWNWANDYETIVPVFLPEFWNGGVRFDEFGTACHLWSSCHEFHVDVHLLKKLREFRNKHFGHNPDLKVAEADKKRVFDALKDLLRENDVQLFVNVGQCLQDLDMIAKGDELLEFMIDIEAGMQRINLAVGDVSVEQKILEICMNVWFELYFREIQQHSETLAAMRRTRNDEQRLFKGSIICVLILVVAFIFGRQFDERPEYTTHVLYRSQSDCLSENYSYPFQQDLPLLPYLMEHSHFIGRIWLLDEIKTYVEHTKPTEKGMIITADMGYGKSALVKYLLCASQCDMAYTIRSKIAAFHICKYDVPATRDPQRFIRRLVGFLSTRFPEFGGIISELHKSALMYDENKCRKDIIACFDQGILFPLLEMKTAGREPLVIIVDALDECFDQRLNDNEIGQLLKARYKKLPIWIKIIVTSRPTYLIDTINNIKRFYLDQNDQRNTADIKEYIDHSVALHPQLHRFQMKLDTLLHDSEGLFLFAVHFIEYLITNNSTDIVKLPSTLDEVYEMNFERTFQSVDDFNDAKQILELIVASLHPLSQDEVEFILENTNVSQTSHTERILKKLAFCFRATREITLVHQSLNAWLISEDNKQFRILAANVHGVFSRYLLNQIDNDSFDIVNIAIHIGSSNDLTLKKVFGTTFSSQNVTKATLHTLVWKSKSVEALNLILNLQVDVDTLNEENVTAAFIAAARGHLDQLKLFKSKGANLNFKVNDAYLIMSPIQLEEIRQHYFFGYGLIHIAGQFGHLDIVRYLLKYDKRMQYTTNGLGLSVTDIACEHGHLNLLEMIFLKYEFDAQRCLYYAAKGGHTNIIRILASHGKNASCVSPVDAHNALTMLTNVDESKEIMLVNTSDHKVGLFNINDLWWKVFQESPLHAAVMAKNEEVTQMVVKYYPHFADCVDSFGMTPLLVSVKENKTFLFGLLAQRIQNERCHPEFSGIANYHFNRHVCPAGSTYAHLDGLYGRFDMTIMLLRKGIKIDWLERNSYALTAVHYAACRGNMLFLQMMYELYVDSFSNIRSNNMSTPYHSAAICGSHDAFLIITSFEKVIPNVVDSENMGILHYLVLQEFNLGPASKESIKQVNSLAILMRVLKNNISIASSDSYGRNILHYALKNGHYLIIHHMNDSLNSIYQSLLQQKDNDGYTPLEFAIHNHINDEDLRQEIPSESSYYDLFTCKCRELNRLEYLSSWEMGLVTVLTTDMPDVFYQFKHLLKDIVLKSTYVTAAFLTYSNSTYDMVYLRRYFNEIILRSPVPRSLGVLARHRPQLFSRCSKLLTKSPLHLIAYAYDADVLMSNFHFLNLAFGDPVNKLSLICVDSRGYNSFHYALIGGNILMAIRLFDDGVSIQNNKVTVIDVAMMMLLGKKKQIVISNELCSDQLSCIDYLLHRILQTYIGDAIVLSDICLKHSIGLSLVHIVAANGLIDSMHILKNKYGLAISSCRNQDNITPFYLWDILNDRSAKDTFNLTLEKHPRPDTETLLILGLLFDFPPVFFNRDTDWQLYVTNRYLRRKITKCNRCFLGINLSMNNFYFTSIRMFETSQFHLINAIWTLERFSHALEFKADTNETVCHDIKSYAKAFHDISLITKFRMSFNYPNLKNVIHLNIQKKCCGFETSDVAILLCIKIYNEFNHALNRIIPKMRKLFIESYLVSTELTNSWYRTGYYRRTELTNAMAYMHTRAQLRRPTLLLFNKGYGISEKQIKEFFRHNYLNVLKKTVRYKYVMETFSMPPFTYNTQSNDDIELKIAHSVPKPFQQIMENINAGSYRTIGGRL